MCYQHVFPETDRIRWWFLIKRTIEGIIVHVMMMFVFGQYIMPIVDVAAAIYLRDGVCLAFLERMLKMSIPSIITWILMFYGQFHCLFNILAEITYFADRETFKDWWNCKSIEEYWR